MLTRCRNPNAPEFERYGGAGISVCERWLSFEAFLADMGERPDGTTIDRIDGSKGYAPGNCRWATRAQQQSNLKSNVRLTIAGRTQTASEWAREIGIRPNTLMYRIARGWPEEGVLSPPDSSKRRNYSPA